MYRSRRAFWEFLAIASLKQFVLQGFLELSEPPIHFSIASGRFLSISDEIAADYARTMTGFSIGLFFYLDLRILALTKNHFVESSLKRSCSEEKVKE